MFISGAYYCSMILLQSQPVATFPEFYMKTILLQSQSTATFPKFYMKMILLQSQSVATFPEFYYHDAFTAILYGSDIPINYFFKTLGIILTYDLMTLYYYKLRFYPKFIDAISYGPKSFQIHGILL